MAKSWPFWTKRARGLDDGEQVESGPGRDLWD
jgi:hypothetical protein